MSYCYGTQSSTPASNLEYRQNDAFFSGAQLLNLSAQLLKIIVESAKVTISST